MRDRCATTSENQAYVKAREDEAGLVVAFRRLLMDESLRKAVGGANRVKVEKAYTLDAMVSTDERIYRDAIEGPGKRTI